MDYDFEKCKEIAQKAHAGQFRKDGKTPYIVHPLAVASVIEDPKTKCAAVLHDVIEDTSLTAEDLKNLGVPQDVVDLVLLVSRRRLETYMQYLQKVKTSKEAIVIKMCDLQHNMSDLPQCNLRDKYELAVEFLKVKA